MLKKTRLSSELEGAFNHRKLKPAEADKLRAIAENYQQRQKVRWSTNEIQLYHYYFGFLTSLKAKAVAEELAQFSYLSAGANYEIVDVGAGTLGGSLGILDAAPELGFSVDRILAIDPQEEALRWAKETHPESFQNKRKRIQVQSMVYPPHEMEDRHRIVLFANVLTEVFDLDPTSSKVHPLVAWAEKAFAQTSGKTLFVFIEPADFDFNQVFLKWRDRWSKQIRVLLPCPHQKACPALQQNEWCHEEREYEAPSSFWNMIRDLGYRKRNLSFSYLVLGKRPPLATAQNARVVSSDVSGKGLCERWLCADGKRWKQSQLLRNKTDANAAFFDSSRGDMINLGILENLDTPRGAQ